MLEELKALIKNPKLWVTMIGVALIPALYNLSFLGSMWDPYGNLEHLPVAVVNQDQTAILNGQTLDIGNDMVDSMSKNKTLDYHFVSQKEAEEGMQAGKYYMVITLPEELSQDAASLMTDHPKKVTIDYQTTAGRSVVASKMSESAVTQLKDAVSKNITETYTTSVFSHLTNLKQGMVTAANGGEALVTGTQILETGSQEITQNMGAAVTGSQTLADGIGTLENGIFSYTNGVAQLSNGADNLTTGVAAYTNGVSALAEGTNQLNANSATLVAGANQLKSSSNQVQTLVDGANHLKEGLQTLAQSTALSPSESENIQNLIVGLPQLNSAIQQLNNTLSAQSMPDVKVQNVQGLLTDISSQAQAILTATQKDKAAEISALKQTSAYKNLDSAQQEELVNAVMTTGNNVNTQAQGILNDVSNMKVALSSLDISAFSKQITQLQTALSQISQQADAALPGATTALQTLTSGIETVNVALVKQLAPGSEQLASGVGTLNQKLIGGATVLSTGITDYTNAVSTVTNGANQLVMNNNSLVNGAVALQNGAHQLTNNSAQLTNGANQLRSGAETLTSGTAQLAQGSVALTDGLVRLSSGITTLTDSLIDAGNQLALVSANRENADAVSDPIETEQTDYDHVKTNGVGMAPYMISVSLMVVALSANVIFAKSLTGRETINRWEWAKQKLLINGFIATSGSLVLYGAIQLLGIEANDNLKTILFIILSAWTFMALVTALVGWDDRYGAFASLVLLLLQIGSAGGSYPIELSPKFFQILSPYLPMTYVVSGLRKTISMTGEIGYETGVLLICLICFMVIAVLIFKPKKEANTLINNKKTV